MNKKVVNTKVQKLMDYKTLFNSKNMQGKGFEHQFTLVKISRE